MSEVRKDEVKEVNEAVRAGQASSFLDARSLTTYPVTKGAYPAGEKLEGDLDKGVKEKPWETDADIALLQADAAGEFLDPATCTTALAPHLGGDNVVEWSETYVVAKKMMKMQRILSECAKIRLPALVKAASDELTNISRKRYRKCSLDSTVHAILVRRLRADAADAHMHTYGGTTPPGQEGEEQSGKSPDDECRFRMQEARLEGCGRGHGSGRYVRSQGARGGGSRPGKS